jgi:arylsulfatase A-like enzyme
LDPLSHRVLDHDLQFWQAASASEKTDTLSDEAWTLAEGLADLGYETAAWVANPWIDDPRFGFGQGFADYHATPAQNADQILQEIQRWLERPPADPKDDRPRFVYAHFMDVHGPYQSTPEVLSRLVADPSLGEDRLLDAKEHFDLGYLAIGSPWKDTEQGNHLRSWRAAYAASVRLLDDRLGPFLEWLRTSERGKRAVLVFTSDHGEDLLEHGRWSHGFAPTLFQHSIRIPMIVRLPGAIGEGRRDDRMTSLFDVMPTLLSLAGRPEVPDGLEGRVLLDRRGRATAEDRAWSFSGAVCDNPHMVSIQDRDYKLIWEFPDGPMTLYDLRHDPAEATDLASREPGAPDRSLDEVRRTMAQALTDRIQGLRARPSLLKRTAGLDSEAMSRLRALGYAH